MEGLCEKHKIFKEWFECRESHLFVSIPMCIILKSLENEDKGIVEMFLPSIKDFNHKHYKMYFNL